MKTKNSDHVPVLADNHPAPGVQHSPPAGYLQHDAENGVEVNQTNEFPPTRFCSTRKALENTIAMFRGTRPATLTTRKESKNEK